MDNNSALATKGMLVDPGDHFKGRFEVEQKYRVRDLNHVRAQLDALRAVAFTIGNSDHDIFFDFPDGRLGRNDQYLILRHMQPSGRVLWISKGPGPDKCVAMDLADLDNAITMLTSLGFVETKHINKQRDIYFLGMFHVTLDDVPGLGRFVELAIMTDDDPALLSLDCDLSQLAETLGLSCADRETRSYRELLV